jgi:hypothetical protein
LTKLNISSIIPPMRLRHFRFPLLFLAQALDPGRLAFRKGIVPHCFTLGRGALQPGSPTLAHAASEPRCQPLLPICVIVLDCSSRPFCIKTPKNMPKMKKTIETIARAGPGPHRPHPAQEARVPASSPENLFKNRLKMRNNHADHPRMYGNGHQSPAHSKHSWESTKIWWILRPPKKHRLSEI